MQKYRVYIVKCRDNTLYTGIAINPVDRVAMHNSGKGAKYTRGRGPVLLLNSTGPMCHRDALRMERRVKKLPRDKKVLAIFMWKYTY